MAERETLMGGEGEETMSMILGRRRAHDQDRAEATLRHRQNSLLFARSLRTAIRSQSCMQGGHQRLETDTGGWKEGRRTV